MSTRLMFFIVNNKVIFESTPSGLTHAEWLAVLTSKKSMSWIESHTRGYYQSNKLVFYTGKNYEVTKQVIIDAQEVVVTLKHSWGLSADCKVQLGENKNKVEAGTLEEFIASYKKL